jgi:hypothetical protein
VSARSNFDIGSDAMSRIVIAANRHRRIDLCTLAVFRSRSIHRRSGRKRQQRLHQRLDCLRDRAGRGREDFDGRARNVVFQPGVYDCLINNYYYRAIKLSGSFNPDGSCNIGAVTVKRSSPGPILFAQDQAISIYNCLTLGDGTNGVGAIASRQYAITDYSNIRFNQTTASHVVAGDSSKINCGGFNEINGGASIHAQASELSFLLLRCEIRVTVDGAFNFAAMLQSGGKSILDVSMANFTGGNVNGRKYIAHDSTIRLPMSPDVPGTGFITGDGAVVERSGSPGSSGRVALSGIETLHPGYRRCGARPHQQPRHANQAPPAVSGRTPGA